MKSTNLMLRFGFAVLVARVVGETLAAEPESQKPPVTDHDGNPLPPHSMLRLGTVRFHDEYVQAAAFSPDGQTLATAAMNYGKRNALWEVSSGRMLRRLKVQGDNPPWTHAVAFSPDGKKLLTGDVGGKVHLWDVATGDEIHAVAAHMGPLGAMAVAFSADGQWYASGGADGVVRVRDTDQGHELLSFDTLPKPQDLARGNFVGSIPGSIAALAFSPNGRYLAAGVAQRPFQSKTGKIRIWDFDANQPVSWIDASNSELVSLVFTPDGKQLVSGGNLTIPQEKFGKPYRALNVRVVQLRVWDVANGKMVHELATPEKEAGSGAIAMSKDGRTLAAGYEGKLLIWDFQTGDIQQSIDVPGWYGDRGLAISADGKIVCAPVGTTIKLWGATTGEPLFSKTQSHTSSISAVAFANDDSFIATSGDSTVRVWDSTTGRQNWARPFGGNANVRTIVVSPDGGLIAAGGQTEHGEEGVLILRAETGDEVRFIPMFEKRFYVRQVRALAFLPNGRTLAVVRGRPKQSNTYDMDLFDVESGKRLKEVACGFFAGVHPMAFTQDGASLYTLGSQDAVVNLWDLHTGAPQRLFTAIKPPADAPAGKPQRPFVADVAFAPDLKTLITSQGRELIVWDIARGEAIVTLPSGGTEHGGNIALSKDGGTLAMTDLNYAGDPGSDAIRLFDLKSQRRVATLEPGEGRAGCFAFSPDGTRLVTGMSNGTALVWDLTAAIKSHPSE